MTTWRRMHGWAPGTVRTSNWTWKPPRDTTIAAAGGAGAWGPGAWGPGAWGPGAWGPRAWAWFAGT
jgi:hypothetical protein